jgi:glycogen(starch) synthase
MRRLDADSRGAPADRGSALGVRRVLMTADAVGGVWTYALDLVRALAEAGVRTSLAVMGPPPSAAQRQEVADLATLLEREGLDQSIDLHESPLKLEWMPDPWSDIERAGEWLLDLEAACEPDIVHLNGFSLGRLPWRAPVVMVGHSCVLSWWRAVHGSDAPPEWDAYRAAVRRGLQHADLVAAPTQSMLDMLQEHYGGIPRTRVIPNGRACRMPNDGRPARQPLVLTAGRLWDEAKNVAAVCAAAPVISWPAYVAGATTDPGVESQPAQASGTNGVTYLGRLTPEEVCAWMWRAGIYALPARYEPFGLSVLEAAQAGCALVLGDIASLREVWADTAMYVHPDDHAALADTIELLIRDESLRDGMARRARARARTMTPARMAAGYLAAYADVIRAARSSQARARVVAGS